MKTYVMGSNRQRGCVVVLPGRLGSAAEIMTAYQAAELRETMIVGVEPDIEWYPMPNGVGNQEDAVRGMKESRRELLRLLKGLMSHSGLRSNEIALAGFSGGAVMAIQCAVRNDEPFAAVVSHSGAILQPRKTPPARFDTPILLLHNKQDDCFEWDERYRPMRRILRKRGHNVHVHEKNLPIEKHTLTYQDVALAGVFLAPRLGYLDWKHSSQ